MNLSVVLTGIYRISIVFSHPSASRHIVQGRKRTEPCKKVRGTLPLRINTSNIMTLQGTDIIRGKSKWEFRDGKSIIGFGRLRRGGWCVSRGDPTGLRGYEKRGVIRGGDKPRFLDGNFLSWVSQRVIYGFIRRGVNL